MKMIKDLRDGFYYLKPDNYQLDQNRFYFSKDTQETAPNEIEIPFEEADKIFREALSKYWEIKVEYDSLKAEYDAITNDIIHMLGGVTREEARSMYE